MNRRRGRSERRDCVFDAMLRQSHDVHVAFDDEDAARVTNGVSCQIEAVELFSLREDGCFGRVEVFWLSGIQYAAAEADDAAPRIVDRKHHAVAEPVVAL